MRLSIVVSTQPAAFTALAYKDHWEESIAKIGSLGYDGVELAVRQPPALDLPRLKSLLVRHGLAVPAIGTGQVFGEEGLSLTHAEEGIREKAIERLKSHIDLAAELEAVVIIGLVRGRRGSSDKAEACLIDGLRECASRNKTVRMAVEPINRYETDIVNTVASGLELLEKVRMENVGLLLDTFHMNIEEPSITGSIETSRSRLFHFHIADSNRRYPGAGHIDFRAVVEVLDKINYQGFFSAEILPLPDPDAAAHNTIDYMRSLEAR